MKKRGNMASKIYLYFGIVLLVCSAALIVLGIVVSSKVFLQLMFTLPLGLMSLAAGIRYWNKSEKEIREHTELPAVDEREKAIAGKAANISWWIGLGAFTIAIYVYGMLALYGGADPAFLLWICALMWIHGFSMPILYVILSKKL